MSTFKVKDGTEIYYKDWGKGQPFVFSHGSPLSDAGHAQMMFLGQNEYRAIAHESPGLRDAAALVEAGELRPAELQASDRGEAQRFRGTKWSARPLLRPHSDSTLFSYPQCGTARPTELVSNKKPDVVMKLGASGAHS